MGLKPQRILSIDWDYVTGDCSIDDGDNKHPHCGYCKSEAIGRRRGHRGFLNVVWKENEERLLDIKLDKDTPIFVAECHANIMGVALDEFDDIPEVVDFDAHYDSYDRLPFIHCGNWIYHLKTLGGTIVSRPRSVRKVGAVFVCHSSPWTPRCMDENFYSFIKKLSRKTGTKPRFIGHRRVSLINGYRKSVG